MSNANKGKVIITCAITGGIHTPTMSPALPPTRVVPSSSRLFLKFLSIENPSRSSSSGGNVSSHASMRRWNPGTATKAPCSGGVSTR